MTTDELLELLNEIQGKRYETRRLELKAAESGCPKRLYDTLSSFSNQDEGGIIVFGVDEKNEFNECGVYDPQDLQKKINEQCLQMQPAIRPLLTVAEKGGKNFVSAEIPGIDITERPCYYQGKGRLKGSYVRVGDSDEPMTEYEIYSYEAFRKKYQDDIRPVQRASLSVLNRDLIDAYIARLKTNKPHLASLRDEDVCNLMSITRNGEVTLSSLFLFCNYPQAFFPQLCITAIALPGNEIGELGPSGERFADNQRIEGNIPEMLDQAISFVRRNMRNKTIINPDTGRREDRADYPITAIREAVLNTLVHRDYSIHTEGMPIQIVMYQDRIEIKNPGGIYGRLRVDQLGKMQADTRNPVLATAMEVLGLTENRYSGIPTIRKSMADSGLGEPIFKDERGIFTVILYNESAPVFDESVLSTKEIELLEFLRIPRSRKEIAEHIGVETVGFAMRKYIDPMIEKHLVRMTIPEKPRSHSQRYVRFTE